MSSLLQANEGEVITSLPNSKKYTTAILDFDGTLSVLRKGWEAVMFQYMYDEIVQHQIINIDLDNHIKEKTHHFIAKSTGVRTLEQMIGLIDLIREFGFVAENEIKDKLSYKRGYLKALMKSVYKRRQLILEGKKTTNDFLISGSSEFLKLLSANITEIYLASGTDETDVIEETKILGVHNYFNGGILGARDNLDYDIKAYLMNELEHKFNNTLANTLVIGDGPVEIREGKKRGAYCIGVASDEETLSGVNAIKRERLIKAGADIIIGDYNNLYLIRKLL